VKRVKRILKWCAIVLLSALLLAQLYRPAKTNPETDLALDVNAHLQLSPEVAAILDRACRDCHSNQTQWPWYSHVAPVSWFVIDHVNDGRSHLNFSEWGRYEGGEVADQLRSICREVRSGVMPLNSYLWMHRNAKLTDEDVKVLCDWVTAERDRISAHY
jgi:hypothetical protein